MTYNVEEEHPNIEEMIQSADALNRLASLEVRRLIAQSIETKLYDLYSSK
jgi:hypothetical protein